MHGAGVRGARFNFVRFLNLDQRASDVRRSMARLRELGRHARLHVHGDDLADGRLAKLKGGLRSSHVNRCPDPSSQSSILACIAQFSATVILSLSHNRCIKLA